MKVIAILLSLLSFITLSVSQKKQADDPRGIRIEKIINSGWTFNYFPSENAANGYESPGFNDSRWPVVSIPHTWNSFGTTGEARPFTRSPAETGETFWWTGWGWYRKHFSIRSELSGHSVFLEFEGVQKYCKVWVNGKYAGDHKGGYGSFDFDITPFLNNGGDNLLAVAVNYLQNDEFRIHPLTDGRFNVSCGIYRNVRLVIKDKLYIPMQGSAAHEGGIFVETPEVSADEAIVHVRTWVKNDYPQQKSCLLQTSICDMKGQVIQVIKSEAEIEPGLLFMFDQTSKPVKSPALWSPGEPSLYTIHSEVLGRKDVTDELSTTFGFRKVQIGEDNALYLNGKKTELRGIDRHNQYPWLGDAVPAWMAEMDYSDAKGTRGCNFIRIIGYPATASDFSITDGLGIIAEEDFTGVTGHGFSGPEQKSQISEMIRRDRNHPSIISWWLGDTPAAGENEQFAEGEDSTRSIKKARAITDSSSVYFIYPAPSPSSSPAAVTAGTEARITVRSSHSIIPADRGSVAIVQAVITDSRGNQIAGAKNTLKWKVDGPGSLSGPSDFATYADSNRKSGEGWYIEMPVTNIVRSDGNPGKITITVFSAGLASGSCEIIADKIADADSLFYEPELSFKGRKPVAASPLVTERIEVIPQELMPAGTDLKLLPGEKDNYREQISWLMKKTNPEIDTSSIEFKALTRLLACQLGNNSGNIPAADYNYNAMHYNNCRLIASYIEKTKLPPLFKDGLRRYYARTIIAMGYEKNAGDEMSWLNWIPSGGVVVMVTDNLAEKTPKGIICTKKSLLPDIIKVVYPQFEKFTDEAKERALIFISRMNPDIRVQTPVKENSNGSERQGKNTAVSYVVEKGVPLLIPEYKFISE